MAEIINLRLARKRKARSDKTAIAEHNRQKHGVSTHIRKVAKAEKAKADIKVDAHFLDKSPAVLDKSTAVDE